MFIGMGLGFLLDSLFTIEERKIKIEIPLKASGFIMAFIGLLFIIVGSLIIVAPKLLKELTTYFVGLGFIAAGTYFVIMSIAIVKLKH